MTEVPVSAVVDRLASQLNATDVGRKVRFAAGEGAFVEDVISEIRHVKFGTQKYTLIKLAVLPPPQFLIPTDNPDMFRLSPLSRIEYR